ncbi:MAG: trypsin-like serine protease [Candidatus Dojkabacteria bacterium]|nr:MAG: trypsin-like serine protease [Candidatus Dojkabacteria bacterium]
MPRTRNLITSLLFVLFGVVVITGISYYTQQVNLDQNDPSALYGGEAEFGYTNAGYLIAFQNDTPHAICGAVFMNSSKVITAAHCIDEGDSFALGTGQLNLLTPQKTQKSAISHPSWDRKTSNNDVATLELDNPLPQNTVSALTTASPDMSCDYRVVSYGRTELDPQERLEVERPRKGADVCITNISENIFYLQGPSGGICVGDSGSPIFKKSTGQPVGVISAIIVSQRDIPCYVGNTAIAVRLDSHQAFLNNAVPQPPTGNSAAQGTFSTITFSSESIFTQLRYIEWNTTTILIVVAIMLSLVIAIMYVFSFLDKIR